MGTVATELLVLPNYRLEFRFNDGSEAIVNMRQRVKAVRFSCLAAPELFSTARMVGDEVIWNAADQVVRASINELLDSIFM